LIERIEYQGALLALIMRRDFHKEGISFITENDGLLQMGYMSHPAGHHIRPHVHKPYPRETSGTQEVLHIKSGKVKVNFYNDAQEYLESRELHEGDWILLLTAGHGFEMLEPTIMIEVKNGPYAGNDDKIRFDDKGTA
jgi:cupin fold WbuC family metalloprotein